MKLKLTNKTKYSTRDLRAFLRAGFRALGARSDKIVVVRYQRANSGVSGRGRVGRPGREAQHIWLHLPRDPDKLVVGDVAHTLHHELLHNRGARHRDMTPEQMHWNGVPAPWTWCVGIAIGLELKKPRLSREERAACREAHARTMLEQWTRKQRLALTIRRKWAAKVRRYERLAAKRLDKFEGPQP